MKKSTNIGLSFLWDFGGKLARNGVSFFVTIFLARLIDPAEFGLIAVIVVFTSISKVFSDTGLSGAIIQRTKVLPIHLHSVFFFNLLIASVLSFIMFTCADFIGLYYLKPKLVLLCKVMSISFVLDGLSTVQNALMKKALKFKELAKFRFYSALISAFFGIYFAYLGYGVWALAIQMLVQMLVHNIFVWIKSTYFPKLQFSLKALKLLWGFGFRIFLSKIINSFYHQIDIIIISKIMSFATLGFYQRSKALNNMINSYSSESLMNIMFPLLSEIQNDKEEFNNKINKVYGVILFLSFFLTGLFYLISEDLIIIMLTEKWRPTIKIFKVMVFGGFILPINGLFITILSSRGNSKSFLKLETLKKITMLLPFITFIFSDNIIIYLYLNLIIGLVTLLINFVFVQKEINIKPIYYIKSLFGYIVLVSSLVFVINYFLAYLDLNRYVRFFSIAFTYFILFTTSTLFFKLHGTQTVIIYLNKFKSIKWRN